MISQLLLIVLLIGYVHSHSWVACTDYRYTPGADDEKYYDNAKCFGFPPGWSTSNGGGFGADTGYNFQAPVGSCQAKYADGYTTDYPKAVWVPGKVACMAWPAKNHAKGTCTNQYIPDGGVVIMITGAASATINLGSADVADDGQVGFQNCPAFCEGGVSDKILCHRCFSVPDLPDGTYKASWQWIFNPGDPYITCFDVEISRTATGNTLTYTDAPNTGTTSTNAATTTSTTKTGTTTTTTTTTSATTTTSNVNGDYNAIMTRYPLSMTATGTVDIEVAYVCKDSCKITIDILDAQNGYAWYGKGDKSFAAASSGTTTITITPQNNPPLRSGYILKAWTVSGAFSTVSQPWLYEASRHEVDLEFSNQVVFSEETSATSSPSKTDGQKTEKNNGAIYLMSVILILLNLLF